MFEYLFASVLSYPATFAAIFLLIVCFNAFVFSPAWSYYSYFRSFRNSPLCGKEMLLSIHELGITFQMTGLEQRTNWDIITQAKESRDGFSLFVGRAFHWLPKSGFATAMEIDQCRELIRANVKKVAGLRPN